MADVYHGSIVECDLGRRSEEIAIVGAKRLHHAVDCCAIALCQIDQLAVATRTSDGIRQRRATDERAEHQFHDGPVAVRQALKYLTRVCVESAAQTAELLVFP